MATAGRVLIIPRGDYSENYTYEMLDMVNHNQATWIAKRESIGIVPSDENSEYWFRLLGVGVVYRTVIANSTDVTEEGFVLDARVGKLLMDAITSVGDKATEIEGALAEAQATLFETATALSEAEAGLQTLITNGTILKATLAIGATSVSIDSERITSDSLLSIYTSVWGVNPTSVTITAGNVTLVFDAQTSVVEVGVRIDG